MLANSLKFYFLVCLFSTSIVFSQDDFITGQLLDKGNGDPVVFATIRVKDKAIGVISNLDGSFRIPEKFKEFGSILEISSLGYVTKDIFLSELAANKTNIIRLDPAIELLDEVVVEGIIRAKKKTNKKERLSAYQIVERAIKNISINYPISPFTAIGYYRDFQINENNYSNLNEALLEVWDQGFNASDYETTMVRVFEHKRNLDFPIDSIAEKPYDYLNRGKTIPGLHLDNYGGNEFTILRIHDALRNNEINAYDYVNVFKTDFIKNHYFKNEGEIILNNEQLYKITFKKNKGDVTIKGNLFVSQEDFSIYRFEYAMFSYQKGKSRKERRTKTRRGKKLLFEIIVGYTPIDGLMYPNYYSMNNTFNVKEPPRFKVTKAHYSINKRYFVISMNNKANKNDALRKNNYKLKFMGKKIKIGRIVHIEDEILLYPDPKISATLFEEIAKADRKDIVDGGNFNIEVKNLRDINNNQINEPTYKRVKQYREFFVQRIKSKPEAIPVDDFYMNKNLPIFENQPISRRANFSDYWMNTPLPNIEE
ncbi:carboxypeptidase-like regulatory domain-containing protein [Maribacter sp. HTCC2170]|uniref:carboxypeptidase-like regulatory domain-containing protein n=1 Tax=Maribacter sp. (strain HTCC2170 / KCCM 42371) TaxID=313603 RepID=UPI00006BE0AB|nr:carboxypeptidase-like regulatory domain-containing protein [Maribacter sp. HTCC2170]EAQ99974.1 putative outer membrane protein, probably involved in nutrient binding [Maribacter sp. HTCC2170]